jgi:ElaA protein
MKQIKTSNLSELIWHGKQFSDLNAESLYQFLRLRSEVFVVEQDCIYQDIDNNDLDATHVYAITKIEPNAQVIAYARILRPEQKYPNASIGRIVTSPDFRGLGLGKVLVERSVKLCKKLYPNYGITISAQKHLEEFYISFDFFSDSEIYLEDDIPHIRMTRSK